MKQLLVVDRSGHTADVLEQTFQPSALKVFRAYNTPEALDLIWDRTIDLVLIDSETIAAEGSALVQSLASPELSQIPVFFMSTKFENRLSQPTSAWRIGTLRKPIVTGAFEAMLGNMFVEADMAVGPALDVTSRHWRPPDHGDSVDCRN